MAMSTINTAPKVFIASSANRNSAARPEAEVGGPQDGVTLNGNTGTQPQPPAQPAPQPPTQPAPQPPAQPPAPELKKWTVMLYSCSDNNLYRFMSDDLNECEKVGTTDQMNVIAYHDKAQVGGTAGYYQVQQNDTPGFTSPVLEDRGARDLGDPKELTDFIKWGMDKYPAQNYMLIMSDHGAAWQGAMSDDSGGSFMSIHNIEKGLKDAREQTGKKIDVLGFDACLMANTETLHQLKDEANFMVASEETEGGAGWTYNRVLSKDTLAGSDAAMRARLDYSPKEMAEGVVRMAQGVQGDLATMAAFDMSKVSDFSASMDNFGKALLNTKVANKDLSATASKTQGFYMEKDVADFANRVSTQFGAQDPALADAAKGVTAAIDNMVVAEQHSSRYPGAHGVQVELNKQTSGVTQQNNPDASLESRSYDKYSNTKFAQENSFPAAVKKFRS